jgi:hypothetical protein
LEVVVVAQLLTALAVQVVAVVDLVSKTIYPLFQDHLILLLLVLAAQVVIRQVQTAAIVSL